MPAGSSSASPQITVDEDGRGNTSPIDSGYTSLVTPCRLAIRLKASIHSLLLNRRTDFDIIIGQCVVSDRNLAGAVLIRRKIQSVGEVKRREFS